MKLVIARPIKMCLNETHLYNKIHMSKYLAGTFSIQNGLKHGDALSPLFSIFLQNMPL
jgi:hypothetical protein